VYVPISQKYFHNKKYVLNSLTFCTVVINYSTCFIVTKLEFFLHNIHVPYRLKIKQRVFSNTAKTGWCCNGGIVCFLFVAEWIHKHESQGWFGKFKFHNPPLKPLHKPFCFLFVADWIHKHESQVLFSEFKFHNSPLKPIHKPMLLLRFPININKKDKFVKSGYLLKIVKFFALKIYSSKFRT
jgi:hypothetical protein